jgi:hypothetical protein
LKGVAVGRVEGQLDPVAGTKLALRALDFDHPLPLDPLPGLDEVEMQVRVGPARARLV